MTHLRKRAAVAVALVIALAVGYLAGAVGDEPSLDPSLVASAQQLFGLEFTPAERDSMMTDLADYLESYEGIRGVEIDNGVPPAVMFNVLPAGFEVPSGPDAALVLSEPAHAIERPENLESLAFWSVRDIGELIRTRKVSSTELTQMYLDRLVKHGTELECVITLTAELAMEQARRADAEIRDGKYRGPLHGIPYGAKDLLAVPGYPTTWGAEPYREQVREETATVVQKLEDAGAVLVAKLTLGALAWGDVWYGGKTRNPWNLDEGSSGSSAGSASATSAGLVAFAIGTETWGSIVSPSTRCGTTGLRPTYGRVSRHGVYALAESMDHIGPMARTVEDAAIMFEAMAGLDPNDPTSLSEPVPQVRAGLLIGFDRRYATENVEADVARALDSVLSTLTELGSEIVEVTMPDVSEVESAWLELCTVEAVLANAATYPARAGEYGPGFRAVLEYGAIVTGESYARACKVRAEVAARLEHMLGTIDCLVCPSMSNVARTKSVDPFGPETDEEWHRLVVNDIHTTPFNFSGSPTLSVPCGFSAEGMPMSVQFVGRRLSETMLCRVGHAFERATQWHLRHPAV
jgi:Asp-tRNA(Asn)/Glu-tRNA(Gln) amidotransferase A subunit family amidase